MLKVGGYGEACRLQRGRGRRTACQETVFGEYCYGVDEEDCDCEGRLVMFYKIPSRGMGGGYTVKQLAEAEEEHCC